MSLINKLSDDVYRNILSYLFQPSHDIKRFDDNTQKFTDLQINKCYICKRTSKEVALSHLCDLCNNDNCYRMNNKCCDNKLICFNCAH